MMPPPMPTMPSRSRPPGPSLMASFAVMGVGLVIAFVSVVAIAIPLLGTFTSSSYAVPGDLRLHLHHARYTVYQHTGTRSAFGTGSDDPSLIRIVPSMVSVRGTDGSFVEVTLDANDETITRGSNVYRGSLEFHTPSDGEYDLTFRNTSPTTVVVARSITDALHSVLAWFATGGIGGLVLICGVVMLIVGATRRGRAKRAMYPGWGPPPGSGPPGSWSQWPGPYPPPGPSPQQWTPPSGAPPQYPPSQYPPPPGPPPATPPGP
jgi:hypothetical protein